MNNGLKGVRVYSIAPTGALTEIVGSPFGTGSAYDEVAITPDGRFLFATDFAKITRFSIADSGTLTPLGNVTLSQSGYEQVSPDGRFLFG